MKTINVLIADGYLVTREGLKRLLGYTRNIKVIGEVERPQDTFLLVKQLHPHVVIFGAYWQIDIQPILDVVKMLKKLSEPYSPWIIVSVDIAMFQDATDYGADEVLPQNFTKRSLISAIYNSTLSGPAHKKTISRSARVLDSRNKLYTLLTEKFFLNDLDEICFKLNIDSEQIPGSVLNERARNLILWCERRNRTSELRVISQDILSQMRKKGRNIK